jgi:hypothetical protein
MRPFVAVSLVALALATVTCGGVQPTYPSLRQSAVEAVPGTWGLVLKPPPTDLAPSVTPARARAIAFAQRPPGAVLETLALVPGSFVGTRHDTPAWVVFARDLCYAQSKGDLVSSSRRDPNDVQRCSDRNIWVTVVDPMTGESLSSLGAYDDSGRWLPATSS